MHRRAWASLTRHRTTLLYVVPLMLLTAAARLVGMGGSPQRIDDEGTYVAQAYAVEKFGELAHYTFWYDHPPLGWLQIAAWTSATGGFDRYDTAVMAGREAMVVASVATAALLWVLARRLGLGRVAAGAAVLVFALSPLSVQFTRTVYLDNVATPWLVAAFVLALSQRKQLLAFAGAAACFAIAVLTKETVLLLLPFLVWQLLRSAHPSTRRYTLSVSGALFVLMGAGYALFALVKGEVLPGRDRVSLLEGIEFQLFSRQSSGSLLDPSSQAGRSVDAWFNLDVTLAVAGVAAALVGLFMHRLRPYAAALLFLTLALFKPGYLPVPYVIAMIPFAVVLVAGVLEAGLRRTRNRNGDVMAQRSTRRRGVAAISALGVVALLVSAVPMWGPQLRGLWLADLDRPLREAQSWVLDNVEPGERILVDDAVWVDLVDGGLPRQDVVWYYKADTDPDVFQTTPNGWADYSYVLVTEGMRRSAGTAPTLDTALENSSRVAVFGNGENEVDVFRVLPGGTEEFFDADFRDQEGRATAGDALADNPGLELSPEAADQLAAGQVDSRVISLLALAAGEHTVQVEDFPVVFGEDGQVPRRTVTLSAIDGVPVQDGSAATLDVASLATEQTGSYRPSTVEVEDGRLTVRYDVSGPEDLLPTPTR